MVLIAILALFLSLQKGSNNDIIPILGSLALGAQRLLPALQQMYSGWASINGNSSGIRKTLDILKKEIPDESRLITKGNFEKFKKLTLNSIHYKYPKSKNFVIQNISLNITRGEKIGIIGKTGCGKSTLISLSLIHI